MNVRINFGGNMEGGSYATNTCLHSYGMHNLERPKFQTLRRAIEFSWATTMCWASGITNIFCTNVGIINEWVSIDIDCNTSLTQIETEQCHSTSQPACSGTVIHIRPHESAHWFLLATWRLGIICIHNRKSPVYNLRCAIGNNEAPNMRWVSGTKKL